MSAVETMEPQLDADTEKQLAREEMAIARKYLKGFPVFMAFWAFTNLICWLSLWPLVIFDVIPLWLGFIVATINVTLCYLPSHEAQHSNYALAREPLRWLNELIGYISTIPLVLPFKIARITHMDHHTYTNDPERDPDYEVKADTAWQHWTQGFKRRQPGYRNAYSEIIGRKVEEGDENAKRAVLEGAVQTLAYWAILAGLAWSGFALEAALLWWLPRHLGVSYISLFLSWAPHFPRGEQGRYRNTRGFNYWCGNLFALGMNHHIIHHLHPGIPLNRNAAAFREMRPILVQRGCHLDNI